MLAQTVGQLPNSVPNTNLNNNILQQQQFYSQQQPALNSNTVQNLKTNNIQQQQFYSPNPAMSQIPNSIQNPQPNNIHQYQQNQPISHVSNTVQQHYQQIGQLTNSSQTNPMLNTIQHQLQTIGQIMPDNNFQSQQAQLYQQPNQSINKPTLPNQTEQTNNNLDKNRRKN